MKKYRKSSIIILFLITIGIFLKVLVGFNEYIVPSDIYTQVYPWINENLNIVSNIELPLWSDNILGGYPIFQDSQHSVFYIFHYILIFFKNTDILLYMIQIIAIIQFLIMAISIYLLSIELNMSKYAALIISITFSFSGFVLSHIQHFSTIEVLKYLPLILLFILRYYKTNKKSNLILITICSCLSVLAGSVQITIYNVIFIFLINIYLFLKKKEYKKGLLIIFYISLGIMMAGIQIIPTMELSYNSLRSEIEYEFFSKNSNHVKNLLTMIFPFLSNSDFILNYSTPINSLYYIGIVPVFLLIVSLFNINKKNLKIWIGIILLYLLSLGENTFIHKIIYEIPILNKFQRSVNWWFYVQFLISILLGYTFDQLLKKENKKKIVSIIIFAFIFSLGYVFILMQQIINTISLFIILNILIFIISFTLIILFFKEKINEKHFEKLILIIFVIDIILNTYNNNNLFQKLESNITVFSNNIFEFSSEDIEILKNNLDNEERIFIKEMSNTGGILNKSTLTGYNPLIIRKYAEFINMFETCLDYRVIDVNNFNTNLLDLFSVKYIVLNEYIESIDNNENYKLIKKQEDSYIYENLEYIPRFYFTEKTISKNVDDILVSVAKEDYSPYKEIYGENLKDKEYKVSEKSKINIVEKRNNYIKLEVNTEYDSYLGTTEIMYNGWVAKVNGENRKIDTINHIFKGLEIEKGNNIVEFFYSPISFKIGTFMSMISIVIFACNIIFYKRKLY